MEVVGKNGEVLAYRDAKGNMKVVGYDGRVDVRMVEPRDEIRKSIDDWRGAMEMPPRVREEEKKEAGSTFYGIPLPFTIDTTREQAWLEKHASGDIAFLKKNKTLALVGAAVIVLLALTVSMWLAITLWSVLSGVLGLGVLLTIIGGAMVLLTQWRRGEL